MNIGKAALMASQLARRQKDVGRAQWYRGAESLFRAQEHSYRAQALFCASRRPAPCIIRGLRVDEFGQTISRKAVHCRLMPIGRWTVAESSYDCDRLAKDDQRDDGGFSMQS